MSTSFYDALDAQQKATIDALSAKQLKEFLKNEGLIVDFGKEALEHLNQVVDKMLQEQPVNARDPASPRDRTPVLNTPLNSLMFWTISSRNRIR